MPSSLPPRTHSIVSTFSDDMTTSSSPYLSPQVVYQHGLAHPYLDPGGIRDPRSSSTQSIRPEHDSANGRRRLLLVYIHGFMGSEASFQSFPAHVHSLLTVSLAESHVVHTKIYPKYQSRRAMTLVRDSFGNWLAPHENENTDVVLLGHSIGGILGAEVVLEPCHKSGSSDLFQHRILGLIAYDTPFLGMHPGVVSTGLASLFRGAPDEPTDQSALGPAEGSSALFDSSDNDPNYNPAYTNDHHQSVRKNKWERAWYFWNKHADNLGQATKSYVKSHFEFGGCLADYPGLKRRYHTLRALEDVDAFEERRGPDSKVVPRVRFVNYYTASTGRIKEAAKPAQKGSLTTQVELHDVASHSGSQTDNVSATDINRQLEDVSLGPEHDRVDGHLSAMSHIDPRAEVEADNADTPSLRGALNTFPESKSDSTASSQCEQTKASKENARSTAPYTDPTREAGEANNKQQRKADAQTREQEKMQQQRMLERQSTLNPEDYDRHLRKEAEEGREPKEGKKRDRKFCSLPSKDADTGAIDSTWIRVYMEGVDEVVAHTSLFNMGDTYAKLVGDTADRIRDWVHEDATVRMLLAEKGFEAV